MTLAIHDYPALVLNADFMPLSVSPLSTWNWQDGVKAVILDRVSTIAEYDRTVVSASGVEFALPSILLLKEYVDMERPVSLTRWNLFLAHGFRCAYCDREFTTDLLTFEHVIPQARGGKSTWRNLVPACEPCNHRKACRTPAEARMPLVHPPYVPTKAGLNRKAMTCDLQHPIHDKRWLDVLYWKSELLP
jgi:5-methylcytosine-specific restriction endonuclease McrA